MTDTRLATAHFGWWAAETVVDAATAAGTSTWRVAQGWVRPDYWVADEAILACLACRMRLDDAEAKHHCRQCGRGFCEACTQRRRRVVSRGWHAPVRVCQVCFDAPDQCLPEWPAPAPNVARRAVEAIGAVSVAVADAAGPAAKAYVHSWITPAYWTPDAQCTACAACSKPLDPIHHCRQCGRGFCDACTTGRQEVPAWTGPQRVCDACLVKKPV